MSFREINDVGRGGFFRHIGVFGSRIFFFIRGGVFGGGVDIRLRKFVIFGAGVGWPEDGGGGSRASELFIVGIAEEVHVVEKFGAFFGENLHKFSFMVIGH